MHFKKGISGNPKVNAILLVKGGIENTHKVNHDKYLTEMRKLGEHLLLHVDFNSKSPYSQKDNISKIQD